MSPSLYLGAGLQPYRMESAQYVPLAPDAAVLSAEDTAALVQSCTTEAQRATLAETGMVDFLADSPYGKYHAYIYAQEVGYLLVIISLHVDAYLKQGVDCRCSDIHPGIMPALLAPLRFAAAHLGGGAHPHP